MRNAGTVTARRAKGQSAKRAIDKSPPNEIEFIARGVLVHGSKVLLCRDVRHGYYALPGGHVEFGESAASALEREFVEECGVVVRARHLLQANEHVFRGRKRAHHEVNIVFLVERRGGVDVDQIRSREAKIAMEWVEFANIVDLDVRPPAAKALLSSGLQQTQFEWVTDIPQS